jgi:peptide/nickel transport system substrate-binding protein
MRSPHRASRLGTATLLLVVVLIVACAPASPTGGASPAQTGGSAQPKAGGTLTVGISTDVLTLDMANYRSGQDWLVGSLIFDSLITWGADGTAKPSLAESWKQVDPLTYQFTLRKDVKFTDGSPFNAAVVKRHFERAAQGNFGKAYYFMIDTIVAEGDTTVTFKLKQPYAAFINNLSIMTGGIMSNAAVDKFGETVGRNPSGSGPFKLSEWVAGERLVLERNPDYWGPKPYLDKIVLRYIADESTRMAGLEAGELQVIQNAPPQRAKDLKSSSTLQLIQGPYAQTIWLGFTHTNPILAKKEVREAIASVVDRDALVQGVTEGITRPASGFVPPEVIKTNVSATRPDQAKAKDLLTRAGYPNGFSIDFWVTTGRYIRDREIAQALQQPLKSIGIDAQIKAMDYAAFSSGMGRHEAALFILGWGSSSNPDTLLRTLFHSKSAANWSDYKNAQIDQQLDDAIVQSSYDNAVKIWSQAEKALLDDFAGVPIYWSSALYGASKKVQGFTQTPLGLYDLTRTWID